GHPHCQSRTRRHLPRPQDHSPTRPRDRQSIRNADRGNLRQASFRQILDKDLPDYRLSSATLFWYKPGTCCCFCGFERMARNKVQFQKGLSEAQFATLYGTEDLCREVLTRWRWPSGFVCPVCGGKHHSIVKTRALYQCTACRRQTSLIAGTIFAATKVPLGTWFRAMYHLTQSKGGISSLELGRRLGVTQTTAWKSKP